MAQGERCQVSGERSADLFGRSAACSWDLKLRRCPRAGALGLRQIDNEKPRTYRTGPRYARSSLLSGGLYVSHPKATHDR